MERHLVSSSEVKPAVQPDGEGGLRLEPVLLLEPDWSHLWGKWGSLQDQQRRVGCKPEKRQLSEITSILCLIYCLLISHRRIPSSAPGAVPSTSPSPPPSTRYRSAADWVTTAESPNSGVTGASLCCGDPTSTWLRQVNYLLLFLEMTNGVKMRKILPSRSPSGQRVNVAMDRAVQHRSCPPHPVGRYVAEPWKVGYSWWSNRANLPPGHRKHNNITAVETFVHGSLKG